MASASPKHSVPPDGPEDVSDFLKRIQGHDNQREAEELEKNKRLEEQIAESKRQREARRLEWKKIERARSLSPEKQSPTASPSVRPSVAPSSSRTQSPRPTAETKATSLESPVTKHTPEPSKAVVDEPQSTPKTPSSATLARNGTLSWQQRPMSLAGSRSRPLSMLDKRSPSPAAASPRTPPASSTQEAQDGEQLSKANIAKSLGSKDPSWFRQTADRGTGSAALRRNNEFSEDHPHQVSHKQVLHGLSSRANEGEAPVESTGASIATPDDQPTNVVTQSAPSNSATTSSRITLNEDQALADARRATRPLSGRISPSKGMGGFVQSAMLARNNSVSKRWSQRDNVSPGKPDLPTRSFEHPSPREESPSRPSSQPSEEKADEARVARLSRQHSRSRSKAELFPKPEDGGDSAPTSPPKRWSPMKSSWLESALSRPDAPKLAAAPPPQNQPSWMVQLNKNRQERMSKDLGKMTLQDLQPSQTLKESVDLETSPERIILSAAKRANEGSLPKNNDMEVKPPSNGIDASTKAAASFRPTASVTQLGDNAKPATPPKKDSIADLKPKSATPSRTAGREELEFKAAFGKLRRTQTQKYVAPDELKDNILRGKSDLVVTGGPQKRERKDELKESLISQKAAMKAKAADAEAAPHSAKSSISKPPPPLPEAIARKNTLTRASDSNDEPALAAKPHIVPKPQIAPIGLKSSTSSKLADRFNPGLAGILARGPPASSGASETASSARDGIAQSGSRSQASSSTPAAAEEEQGAQLNHMTKGRARGPKRRLPKAQVSSVDPPVDVKTDSQPTIPLSSKSRPEHSTTPMTMGLPTKGSTEDSLGVYDKKRYGDIAKPEATTSAKPLPPSSSRKVSSNISQSIAPSIKPSTPTKPGPLGSQAEGSSPTTVSAFKADTTQRSIETQKQAPQAITAFTRPTNATAATKPSPSPIAKPLPSPVTKQTTIELERGKAISHTDAVRKDPIKLPTQKDEDAAMERAGLNRLDSFERPKTTSVAPRSPTSNAMPNSPLRGQLSKSQPPIKPSSPKPEASTRSSATLAASRTVNAKPKASPLPQNASEATRLFYNFFDTLPVAVDRPDFDAEQVLLQDKSKEVKKIKSLRRTIQRIKSDGELIAMPIESEHVLFTQSMYLCSHVFGTATGSRTTEVYLWAGNEISDAVIEQTQAAARKAAKEAGGTLHTFRQGKESANFFQALGDILITRRGSEEGPSSKSLLLCGRRHLGHIAFDEVAFELPSFCAGFPFIVIPDKKPDKVYLWIGKGCSAEELGCARLISMDMSSTNEVTEIEDGAESSEFLSLFPLPSYSSKPSMPRSADHWKLKAKREDYQTRLYRVEYGAARPVSSRGDSGSTFANWTSFVRGSSQDDGKIRTRITEIIPFTQRDLEVDQIYVLDAFFELYVIVGILSTDKAEAFSSAVRFAQEYAIIAASAEDRPHVPFGTVVLEGAPRDMKRVFRQWDDNLLRTEELGRGVASGSSKGLKVVSLHAAIDALKKA